jgi:hypothetical protein
MDVSPPARVLLTLVVVSGLLLASVAVFLSVGVGDPIGPLFRQALTIQVILGVVVWSLLAWAARRLVVGRLGNTPLTSTAALVWGGFRVALLIAAVTVIVCGLASLVLGLEIGTAFVRALVLIVVVTAFTGIIGGAFFNSLLVVRRLRERPTQ